MEPKTISTNFKTLKKSILGKYDQYKAYGMVWTQAKAQIYINFDLDIIEEEATQKLTSENENNNLYIPRKENSLKSSPILITSNSDDFSNLSNFQSISIDDTEPKITKTAYKAPTLLDQLYFQSEEISRKITYLIKNANNYESENFYSINKRIDDLKEQRRSLLEKIEIEEMSLNSKKLIEKEEASINSKRQNLVSETINTSNEYKNDSKNAVNKENYYLCINKANDEFNLPKEQSTSNIIDEQKQQKITDMMKNLFHCYDYTKKNDDFRIYLYTNEKILISKLIDQNRNNFFLNENDIKFIGMDLCYLIPGMTQKGITIIIIIDYAEENNSELSIVNFIDERINYLKEKCQIEAEKIVDSDDILESSILTSIFKNEIKFLYLTYDAIINNSKLVSVLNAAKSKNNISRIVFIRPIERKSTCTSIFDFLDPIKTIVEEIKEVPILIITTNLHYENVDSLPIPLEIIKEESYESNNSIVKKKKSILNQIHDNLFLEVMRKKSPLLTKNMEDIFNWLIGNHYIKDTRKMKNENYDLSCFGIIFCLTNRDAESINTWLNKNGVPSAFFHSKMNESEQKEVIFNWEKGGINIVVISDTKNDQTKDSDEQSSFYQPFVSKIDIRFIVHYSIPKSFSDYITQLGFIGKDGLISHSLIMFNEIDVKIIQRVISSSQTDDKNSKILDLQKSNEDEFRAIVDYCIDDDDKSKNRCRRVEIMNHYDLEFHYQDCFYMCDRCKEQSIIEDIKFDTTEHAKNMLKIINVLNRKENPIKILPTLRTIIDIYVGNKCIKKKTSLNNNQEIESTEYIVPPVTDFKGKRKIILIKTLKALLDREIIKTTTKKTAHGYINYFESEASIEAVEDPIFI